MIKKFSAIFLLLTTTILIAQRTNSSPYSFFGMGEEYSPKTTEQASMGGLGVANSSSYHLNFINPALNANLRVATYTLGANINSLSINDGVNQQSSKSNSLSYVALGFPIGNKAGFSLGLQPLSAVGYSFSNSKKEKNTDNTLTEVTNFKGKGGTNRIFGSFGITVLEGLSLGIEADFVFGNIENIVTNQRLNVDRATRNKETVNIRGSKVRIGVHYENTLQNDLNLSFGTAATIGSSLKTTANNAFYTLKLLNSGREIIKNTKQSSTKGKISLPMKTVVGVAIGKTQKWNVGIEYEFQKAFKNSNVNVANQGYSYGDSNRFSIGGYYLPRVNSLSSYWNRVTYRAGLRFEDTGLLVSGKSSNTNYTAIKDFGINIGLGLPLPKQLSNINLGFEYGQKGTLDNNLIKENYYNIKLGISLNDINWFRKRKID